MQFDLENSWNKDKTIVKELFNLNKCNDIEKLSFFLIADFAFFKNVLLLQIIIIMNYYRYYDCIILYNLHNSNKTFFLCLKWIGFYQLTLTLFTFVCTYIFTSENDKKIIITCKHICTRVSQKLKYRIHGLKWM